MESNKKINNKEIVLRQWFAAKYGNQFEDSSNWTLPKGIAEMNREYTRDNPNLYVSFNFFMYKVRDIEHEVRTTGTFALYDEVMRSEYLDGSVILPSSDMPAGISNSNSARVVAAPVDVKLSITKIDDMSFPTFRDFPTDTVFDKVCSDDDELKGFMSGMVVICTGESGVGKSTLLVDVMSKIEEVAKRRLDAGEIDKEVKGLYISTEMTKTDIYFYKKKMPAIGRLNTILVADYLKHGLKEMIVKAFESDEYDIVLLDSYQDLVEKMCDTLNWRAKEAENFLINLMVTAAEEKGKCVLAIQHLTKGGEYVGRTFLKHTTTAMLELKFDKAGARYAAFSKNRRAGSMMAVPVYFTLENGQVVFDEKQFNDAVDNGKISKNITERMEQMSKGFDSVFNAANRMKTEEEEASNAGAEVGFRILDDEEDD